VSHARRPGRVHLWGGWLLAPLAWFVQLELAYALVPWTCGGRRHAVQYLVAAVMLAAAATGVALAWRTSRALEPAERSSLATQTRYFLALSGAGLSLLFLLAMVATTVPTLILRTCD